MKTLITFIILFFINLTILAQNNGSLYIENPTVNGSKFSWEVHFTPTNAWAFPQSLGDCSWYFNYNSGGLSNPVLTFVGPELSTAVYANSTGLAGGKIQITTDITIAPPDFGTILVTGTKYHLYTVEMDITSATVQSLVEWDQVNTGIFNGLDAQVVESYNGSGDIALPVELSSFSVNALEGTKAQLKWTTATEVDNYGFEIERSAVSESKDALANWAKVAFVEGNGNSNSQKNYSYTDNNLVGGSKFKYRLKQIDNDGKFEYSDAVEVEVLPAKYELMQNYPNPFNPTTKIKFTIPEDAKVTINIFNLLGEKVTTLLNEDLKAGFHQIQFNSNSNSSGLASGIYLYSIETKNFKAVKKMILMK